MLPPGVSLDPATGALTGLPTAPGTYTGTVRAQDAAGNTFLFNFTVTVVLAPAFVTPATLPQAEAGVSYSVQLEAQGGTPPYSKFEVIA